MFFLGYSCRVEEILSSLLSRHQKFLLDDLRRRRTFGLEAELEVADDPDSVAC
jgi:hypothetical protein